METMTRTLGHPVVVSGDFVRDWPEGRKACHCLGYHPVKGRTLPVEIWIVKEYPESTL
jgi:class 3 adenylate cyclase